MCTATFPQATPMHSIDSQPAACLVVLLSKRIDRPEPGELALTLVSSRATVSAQWVGCEHIEDHFGLRSQFGWMCRFRFHASDAGCYDVALRGDVCRIKRNEVRSKPDAFASTGFNFGMQAQVRTTAAMHVCVTRYAKQSQSWATLPPCTFAHEEQLATLAAGAPRWSSRWRSDTKLRTLWYNDTLQWGNDVCRYVPLSMPQLSHCLSRNNRSSVLFIGDSLTRQNFQDYADLLRGTTQRWLEQHPLNCSRGCNGTNWQGHVTEFSRNSWGAALPENTGFPGSVPQDQRGPATAGDASMLLQLLQFLPGLGRWQQPHNSRPLAAAEWAKLFRAYLEAADNKPRIVVFNVGQWLIGGRWQKGDPSDELTKMVEAMLQECDRIGASMVWRASLPDHTRYDADGNALLRKLNGVALEALDAYKKLRPGVSHFALQTAYLLGAARPDRTSDGFHYGFREVDSHQTWMACSDPRHKGDPFPNCIRDADWPPAVGRALSLVLANLLCFSDFGHVSSSRAGHVPRDNVEAR